MSTHARLIKPFRVWRTGPAGPLLPFRRFRHDQRFIALALSAAANSARVEAVAKELFKHDGWSYGWKTCGVAPFRLIYLARARAALSALSPKLVNKEKTL